MCGASRAPIVAVSPGHPRGEEAARMANSRRTLSREQVMTTERQAWVSCPSDGGREYFFDGINFWRHHGRVDAELIAPWRTPDEGWHHRTGCGCQACSSKAVALMSTRISGSLVRGVTVTRAERVRTYAAGRVCAAEGCITVLSIYNPSRFCGLHSTPDRSTHPGAGRCGRCAGARASTAARSSRPRTRCASTARTAAGWRRSRSASAPMAGGRDARGSATRHCSRRRSFRRRGSGRRRRVTPACRRT